MKADFIPERADLKPERADFRLQGALNSLCRLDFDLWGADGGTIGYMEI